MQEAKNSPFLVGQNLDTLFATMKQLPIDEFIAIFNVKAYGEETDQTSI
jgi:hypothetical protein